MFNRVAGQVEVPAGQVNLRVSLPRSENNVLQPMLHPGEVQELITEIARTKSSCHLSQPIALQIQYAPTLNLSQSLRDTILGHFSSQLSPISLSLSIVLPTVSELNF